MPPRLRDALPAIAVALVIVGFVNFFWFFFESMSIGGDALNGKVVEGHYFVSSHGALTEVDRSTWEWSRIHAISVFITHPLALLGMAYLVIGRAFPSRIAGRVAPGSQAAWSRVVDVRASGPSLASSRVSGGIGSLTFSRSLSLDVRPGGILVKPMLMPEVAILANEVAAVRAGRRWLRAILTVDHAGIGMASPLFVLAGEDSELARVLRGLPQSGPFPSPGLAAGAERPVPVERRVRGWLDQEAIPGIDPRLSRSMEVFGLLVSLALLVIGFGWAIPRLGAFGVFWTIALVGIIAVNAARFFLRGRR
jgi:hypothetical protein